ncbi:hypothetical protein LZQ00_04450 [Sphingobacterium sp. SRCM116780]|uniref:hypothetical protein n=1 Tax=Sphingobacterium sp. SRCM116780 TaxID=2907623 RepID=UPI001F1D56BA|nr:hypothetical protein [Sphingobacterium sp. SRCM116780]UIR57067.1 hypothetical protein LZQ00_04450 [Sphingobacterium sp. SRCM116780]
MFLGKRINHIKITPFFRRKLTCFLLFFVLFSFLEAHAQQQLSAEIQMPAFPKTTVGQVFQVLKDKQATLFSFNSNILQTDSIIHVAAYKGSLFGYLDGILGKEYSFKEIGKHIIMQYTPQRMSVDFEVQTDDKNKVVILGYIKNIRTNKPISDASIFDRDALLSTLTDKNGYFELDVKKKNSLIAVNVSKEMFRDTSVMVIFPIEAKMGNKKRKYGYFTGYGERNGFYQSFFGRAFLSPAQSIQNMNLGGLFLYSPYQVSMTPGLSSHGFIRSQIVNKFSMNILGGSTAGVKGVEIGGVFNLNQYDMQGLQFVGGFNIVGGQVRGMQIAGLSNQVFGDVKGLQMAGGLNGADTVKGVQIGGIGNIMKEGSDATQLAGAFNHSTGTVGHQMAGIANIAKKVKGIQLAAVVNIADSSDYPIGLLNFIKNGEKSFSLAIDQDQYLAMQFRSGGRVLYSLLAVNVATDDNRSKYALEAGLGAVVLHGDKFMLRAEISSRNHLTNKFKMLTNNQSTLRLIPELRLSNKLSLFVSPSFSYAKKDDDAVTKTGKTLWKVWGRDKGRNSFFGGAGAGIMLKL